MGGGKSAINLRNCQGVDVARSSFFSPMCISSSCRAWKASATVHRGLLH